MHDADTFALNFSHYPLAAVELNYISVYMSCSSFAFFDCILRRGEKNSLWYGFDYNLLSVHETIHDLVAHLGAINPKHSYCWLAGVCLIYVFIWSVHTSITPSPGTDDFLVSLFFPIVTRFEVFRSRSITLFKMQCVDFVDLFKCQD